MPLAELGHLNVLICSKNVIIRDGNSTGPFDLDRELLCSVNI
jgi:hypothetical protein